MQIFSFDIVENDGHTILVDVSGEIDTMTVPLFEKKLNDIIVKDCIEIILSFDNLTFICSAGIGTCAFFHEEIEEKKYMFKIINIADDVYDLFEQLDYDKILNLEKK